MDKIQLQQILSSYDEREDELYDQTIIIDKEKTDFNRKAYNEIVYFMMYLYHKKNGIETIRKRIEIPKLIERNVSYSEFKEQLEQYKNVPYQNPVFAGITDMFHEIWRLGEYKLLGRDSWSKIYSTSINEDSFTEYGKIYLSVDNKDLYQFAFLLATACIDEGIKDYEFKVNNDPSINRRDNVVIYFTMNNLNKYISVIQSILQKYPSIQLNEEHIFAHSIGNGICIANDYKDGSSFTRKICSAIKEMRKQNYSDEEIIKSVEEAVNSHLASVLELVGKSSSYQKEEEEKQY